MDDTFNDDFLAGIDDTNDAATEYGTSTQMGELQSPDEFDEFDFDELINNQIDEETTTKNQTKKISKKKAMLPVFICLLCALICIIATALILFVIPSRYRIWSRVANGAMNVIVQNESTSERQGTTNRQNSTPVYNDTPSPYIENVPAARSDEIVVAPPNVETVAPARPVASPRTEDDIIYRIKWGDTLWDISEAYYKNPWRYRRIAAYNNIRDPDYIISGTVIRIPAE